MADPFAVLAADGLNDRLDGLMAAMAMRMASRPDMKNIHALLAYQDQPGVREKFDARFGAGSADAVIAAANKSDGMRCVADCITALNAKLESLSSAIDGMKSQGHEALMAKLDALTTQIATVKPAEAKPVDMGPVASALADMAQKIAQLTAMHSAPRTIITDVNGDPIGIKIGG